MRLENSESCSKTTSFYVSDLNPDGTVVFPPILAIFGMKIEIFTFILDFQQI